MILTQERVRELLDYREDGNLIRLVPMQCVKAGAVAGSLGGTGYLQTMVDGKKYRNHRLIWLWHFGYLPEHGLDHIDRDQLNNRIENLREVSQTCNMRNTGNPVNNTSGTKGVSWKKRASKWVANITINQEQIGLGYHDSKLEAACHRLAAEQAENWEGCDSSSPAYQYVMKNINKERLRNEIRRNRSTPSVT